MSSSSTPPRTMTAIVAATLSNGIGKDGGLPWRLPGEMKYFARVTTGPSNTNAVIMGRKTWDGIPFKFRPLKDRHNLVISRSDLDLSAEKNTTTHKSISSALSSIPQTIERIFLIGGAQLYNLALDSSTSKLDSGLVDRVLLTRVVSPEYECDTFLDDFTNRPGWKLSSHNELCEWVGWEVPEGEVEEKGVRYRFEMWVKG